MSTQTVDWSKKSEEERILKLESIYVLSPVLEGILVTVDHCRSYSRYSREPKCLLIEGRTGVGKTTLCEYYVEQHPIVETGDSLVVPVLYLKIEVPATIMNLVSALLAALGDPAADKGSIGSKTRRLRHFLKELKVELIILDEFQHFIDRDSLKVLKTLSDWLKLLVDTTQVPMMLLGMPYCHFILDARGNEQLKRRFSLRRMIDPFGWGGTKEEQQDFRTFLRRVDNELPFNKRSNLSDRNIAFLIFYATNGIISYVMELVRIASLAAIRLSLENISIDLLADAYDESLALAYPDRINPFNHEGPLKLQPFKDEFPDLRSLGDLKDKNETIEEIFRRR